MPYDLLLDEEFPPCSDLHLNGYDGFCFQSSSLELAARMSSLLSSSLPCYTRIDICYSNKLDQAAILRLRKYDLVCVTTCSSSSLLSIIKLGVDLIRIDLDSIQYLKKSTAGMLKENGLFVEIVIRDMMGNNHIKWMNALRRMLRLRFGPILVLSSGAKKHSDLRTVEDVIRMLMGFGLKERAAKRIVLNSERVLCAASLKRYTFGSTIANSIDEGRLKRDFILRKIKNSENKLS